MDNNFNRKNNENNQTWAVVGEILRLLLLLCWKAIKALGRLIKKFGKFLLKIIVRGLLWLIDATGRLVERTKLFWNDNNTQDKLRKISKAIKKVAKALIKALGIALLATLKTCAWTLKKAFSGLIHLKSTLKSICNWTKKNAIRFAKWIAKGASNFAQWIAKQKTNYKNFRKNKGFKGLLLDLRNGLKGQISSYLDEEQEEDVEQENNQQEVIDTDNFIDIDEDLPDKGVTGFGKRLYKAMKNIVEE